MARKVVKDSVELSDDQEIASTESEEKQETPTVPTRYRIPPVYLDSKKDADTIKELEAMVEDSSFKSPSDLVRHMVRVMLPVIKDHPVFSNKAAIASLREKSSIMEQSGTKEYSRSTTEYQEVPITIQTERIMEL